MPQFDIDLFNRGASAEQQFLLKLHIALGEDFIVSKTISQYNTIDFIIKKRRGKDTFELLCYLELKSRTDLSSYPSLMIGKVKIQRIKSFLRPTILVWVCEKTDTLYYMLYTDKLLNIQTNTQNNSAIILVPKSMTLCGFDGVLNTITNF